MSEAINTILNMLRKESQNVVKFATSPTGIFETIDQMIKDARVGGRQALASVGVKIPQGLRGQLRGQALGKGKLPQILKRFL